MVITGGLHHHSVHLPDGSKNAGITVTHQMAIEPVEFGVPHQLNPLQGQNYNHNNI